MDNYSLFQVLTQFLDDKQKKEALAKINEIFDKNALEPLYKEQRDAVYNLNIEDLERQYKQAERANRFGLARHGLFGGQVDVDSNADLQTLYGKGRIKADAAANLRNADESARQSLVSLALSGVDTGTAQIAAQQQLAANQQNALGERAGNAVAGLFDNLSNAYLYNKQRSIYEQNPYASANAALDTHRSYKGNT